jgi:hypothetical protein
MCNKILTKAVSLLTKFILVCSLVMSVLAAAEFGGTAVAQQPNAGSGGARTAAVSGMVWNDVNHDGVFQAGEPGMSGIAVTLYFGRAQVITSTQTSDAGTYTFSHLEAGTYLVGFGLPETFTYTVHSDATSDSQANKDGFTGDLAILPGGELSNVNAGLWQAAIIGGGSGGEIELKHAVLLPFMMR